MDTKVYPIRLSQEHIDAHRDQIKTYVVLPIPNHAQNVPFETIGVTTFKKYILKSYQTLFCQPFFTSSVYTKVPFVISDKPVIPHVVHTQQQQQTQKQPQTQQQQPSNPPKSIQSQPQLQSQTSVQAQTLVQAQTKPVNDMADFTLDSDKSYYEPSHSKCSHLSDDTCSEIYQIDHS